MSAHFLKLLLIYLTFISPSLALCEDALQQNGIFSVDTELRRMSGYYTSLPNSIFYREYNKETKIYSHKHGSVATLQKYLEMESPGQYNATFQVQSRNIKAYLLDRFGKGIFL